MFQNHKSKIKKMMSIYNKESNSYLKKKKIHSLGLGFEKNFNSIIYLKIKYLKKKTTSKFGRWIFLESKI